MFPLKQRKIGGYKFSEKTWYTAHHLGVDYLAKLGTPIYAPFDGKIVNTLVGEQGGKTIWFKPEKDNVIIRFMHLSQIGCMKGDYVFEGKLLGLAGNTGSATTGAHLHLDISKKSIQISNFSNFLDPEKYEWTTPEIAPETPENPEIVESTTAPIKPAQEPPMNSQSEPVTWRDEILEILTLLKKFFNLLK